MAPSPTASAKKKSTKKAAKKPGAPIEYITPPNVLRAKLKSATPCVYDPLAAADNALDNLSRECESWMAGAIDTLHDCRVVLMTAPGNLATRAATQRAAMDLKGLAKPGNNPAADRFATSLITLLTEGDGIALEEQAAEALPLLNAHVDAIRATLDHNHTDTMANMLAAELEQRTHALLGL